MISKNRWMLRGRIMAPFAAILMVFVAVIGKSGTVTCPGRSINGPCWYTPCEPSLNCVNNVCKKSCFSNTNYGWADGGGNVCQSGPNSEDACESLEIEGALFNHYRSCCAADKVSCLNAWTLFPNAASNPMSLSGTVGYNRHCAPST